MKETKILSAFPRPIREVRTHDKLSLPASGSRWEDKDRHTSTKQSQVYDLPQDCTTLSMDENCKEPGSYHCTSTIESFFFFFC